MTATKHIPPSSQPLKRARRSLPTKKSASPLATITRKPPSTTKTTARKSPHFPSTTTTTTTTPRNPPTPYQALTYAHLLLIPPGHITSYLSLANAVAAYRSSQQSSSSSQTAKPSPRAVGGALRANPFAPEVPCHRVIAANGYVGGFMGDWDKAPSGVNQVRKLELLKGEGVVFDGRGRLVGHEEVWFDGPWEGVEGMMAEVQRRVEGMAKDNY